MSQIKTLFEYNGASYEFDARDADDAERLEKALEELGVAEKNAPKEGKTSNIIRAHCAMLKAFFDTALAPGAGNALCTEKANISACYKAYDAFLQLVRAQKEDVTAAKNVFAEYSNRAQRRAAAHTKPKA